MYKHWHVYTCQCLYMPMFMPMFMHASVYTCQCLYMPMFIHANVCTCQCLCQCLYMPMFMPMFIHANVYTCQCLYSALKCSKYIYRSKWVNCFCLVLLRVVKMTVKITVKNATVCTFGSTVKTGSWLILTTIAILATKVQLK